MKALHSRGALAALMTIAVLIAASPSAAEDLAFHEAGARAASLGGAFTAISDDATALFYNPAGLAFLPGIRFKAGLAFGDRTLEAYWPPLDSTLHSSPNEFLGSLAVAWQPARRITLAVGVFTPYSYRSSWTPNYGYDWDCRENMVRATSIRAALAVELFKGFAVSGGLDLVRTKLDWKHYVILDPASFAENRHRMSGHGLGFTAGVLWRIVPAVRIGARFRQAVPVDLTGTTYPIVYRTGGYAPATGDPGAMPAGSDIYGPFPYQAVTGRLTWPRELAVGAAVAPLARLTLSADVQWERWSEFGDWVFEPAEPGNDPDYGVQGVPLGLVDTTHVKAGLEYRPARRLALRAGYTHLTSAVDEAHRTMVYPDLARNIYSLGFGYEGPVFDIYGGDERVSDLSFDLFIRYAPAVPADSTYPGYEMTYSSRRIVFGVGVGFMF
jgi:long-chain fatty acid transport protein